MASKVITFHKRQSRALVRVDVNNMLDKYDWNFDPRTVERQGCTEVPNYKECAYDCAFQDHASLRKCQSCTKRST